MLDKNQVKIGPNKFYRTVNIKCILSRKNDQTHYQKITKRFSRHDRLGEYQAAHRNVFFLWTAHRHVLLLWYSLSSTMQATKTVSDREQKENY